MHWNHCQMKHLMASHSRVAASSSDTKHCTLLSLLPTKYVLSYKASCSHFCPIFGSSDQYVGKTVTKLLFT